MAPDSEGRPRMRAAIVEEVNTTPVVGSVDRPVPGDGDVLIKVSAAALNPHDLVTAAGIRARPPVPYVTGSEGVGFLEDGTRVYFGPIHLPNGSMAEYAVVAKELVTPIPAGLSDADALGLGVAGTTAWLAMTWKAHLQPGESVLVMGATGAVGQIAVQAARLLGASRVVAAGRRVEVLQVLLERGADQVVVLADGYEQRLIDTSEGGFDLVVDSLFATTAAHREAFERMTAHVLAGELIIESETLPIDDIASAWKRQAESPNKKLVIVP